jgi:hypothetical protein
VQAGDLLRAIAEEAQDGGKLVPTDVVLSDGDRRLEIDDD